MIVRIAFVAAVLAIGAYALWHPVTARPLQTQAARTVALASGLPAGQSRHTARRPGRHSRKRSCAPLGHRDRSSHGCLKHPAPPAAASVDVNRADAAELARVPGIGRAIAERIVALRAEEGAFASLDELLDGSGMSPARLDRAQAYLKPP
jgi:competence ComEA-like helix-hairpin-helix protein